MTETAVSERAPPSQRSADGQHRDPATSEKLSRSPIRNRDTASTVAVVERSEFRFAYKVFGSFSHSPGLFVRWHQSRLRRTPGGRTIMTAPGRRSDQ